jgi:hypothetical protein
MPATLFRRAARVAPTALVLTLTCAALADDAFDITRVAPPKAAIVVTIPSFSKLQGSFESSELGKLWHEPGVQDFVQEMSADASKRLGDFLKELGAESKDLKPPTGGVGLALYMPTSAKAKPDHKREDDSRIVMGADAGENAAAWKELLEKLIDKAAKDKDLTSEEDTVAGVHVTVLKPVYKEAKDLPPPPKKADDSDEDDDGPVEPEQTGFAQFVGGSAEHPGALTIAWIGSTVIAANDTKALEHAIDAQQGRDSDSLAGEAEFKAALDQQPADAQASVYVNVGLMLSQTFERAIAERAGMEEGDGSPDPVKFLGALGLSQVKYVSAGFRMDTPQAVSEIALGVLCPEKKGLISLLSEPLGAFDPPSFIAPDAASVTRVSFRFDKVYDVLRDVAATLPEEQSKQFLAGLDQSVNLVKPGVDALGPAVWFVGSYRQPLDQDSAMNLVAIDVKDQAVVSNTLSFFAGQAQGMAESREFQGNTIYTVDFLKLSVGLGFNRLFIGPTPAVENALRLAGAADAPRISGEAGFKDATQGFGTEGVIQSYSDTGQTLRWLLWSAQNADKIAAAQIEEAGLEPEQKEKILQHIRDSRPKWLEKLPGVEVLLRHIGDSAAELHPTPDGFRGRSLMLKPVAK